MSARELLSDVAILGGAAAIVFGVSLLHPAGAWIVGGVLVGAFGVLLGRSES